MSAAKGSAPLSIVSGPAKAEPMWQLVRTALFLGFALYFVYDGLIGYPSYVVSEAKKRLQEPEPWGGKIQYDQLSETPTNVEYEHAKRAAPTSLDQVVQHLGKPQLEVPESRTRVIRYFVSRWGFAAVPFESGKPDMSASQWHDWYKKPSDIRQQFFWAIVPTPFGLYFLIKLIKALRLKVVVDEQGLVYAGKRIAWDAMTGLRGYSPKGWIDLYYNDEGKERKLRFDNEKFRLFDEVVAAICEKKDFINEIEAYKADQARRHADEEAARAAEDQAPQEPEEK